CRGGPRRHQALAITTRCRPLLPCHSAAPRSDEPGITSERLAFLRRLQQAAQDVLQDAAVAEVLDLVERVDTAGQGHGAGAAIGAVDRPGHVHARLYAVL